MPDQQEAKGCVLFADVSGSTKLYEAVGDKLAHAAIDADQHVIATLAGSVGDRKRLHELQGEGLDAQFHGVTGGNGWQPGQ